MEMSYVTDIDDVTSVAKYGRRSSTPSQSFAVHCYAVDDCCILNPTPPMSVFLKNPIAILPIHIPGAAYPLKGILYLIQHASLARPIITSFLFTLLAALTTIPILFLILYRPQHNLITNLLSSFPTLLTFTFLKIRLTTWTPLILCLAESSLLVSFLMNHWAHAARGTIHLFQDVLKRHDTRIGPLVQDGVEFFPSSPPATTGLERAFELFERFALWVVTFPLNFVPGIGTAVFLYLNGKARGGKVHEAYFDLKGMNFKQRERWVAKRRVQYTAFGVVAQALEMLPGVGFVFGAALWAVELEEEQEQLRKAIEAPSKPFCSDRKYDAR
ncbi:hypothetical protein BC936DRAFT_149567 [Jimgerdemannia flammicorona]|uniref:Uncharacterized protein n=1 Tax=Jimgerdemannia flammicorona TaxID=994334 RepID=A0A433D0K9_9FUNG|nr:hypothetical protein BC936DRAFT_149567 [Jimgerdemannia flammicorona]